MTNDGISTVVIGVRYDGKIVEDPVALEFPVNIYINDKHFVTVFATPHELREMAVGHLLGQGIVDRLEQIEDLAVDGLDILAYVNVDEAELGRRLEKHKEFKLILTSCGSVEDYIRAFDNLHKPRVSSDFRISLERLRTVVTEFGRLSKHTVSVHTAAVYSDVVGKILGFSEDVSRHVTVDKIIGKMALKNVDFSKCVLLTTGRQASDMVLKAARVGMPVTVSLRGPIFSGLYAALKSGVTLVSMVRGKGLTIYSHPERIIIYNSVEGQLVS
ncbi:MAG: formate dehydrogenase accessory sulfurtransferase FdhD [Candidatus Caldarchaeum sp.]